MEKLTPTNVALDDLYLDPNNPRFADVDVVKIVPEDRVHEEKVQERAIARMLDDRFDVRQLEDSIRTIGFLPVDRLVAIELPQPGKYMVIEGNRRLAALKSVRNGHESGEVTLSPEVLETVNKIPILVIDSGDKDTRNHLARVLQGVRHLSSVKQWGPYQQAQLIATMLQDGKSMPEIKEVLGLSTQRINSLRRCYFALAQMRKDPDFGDDAKPALFSHFEEALKIPTARTWLGWDDENNTCTNHEHRQQFYAWCVGVEDNGQRLPAKITDAKDLRLLPTLMEDPVQFKRFIEDNMLTMRAAAQGAASSEPQIDWRGIIRANINTLDQVPALALAQALESDISLLEKVKQQCDQLLQIIWGTKGAA